MQQPDKQDGVRKASPTSSSRCRLFAEDVTSPKRSEAQPPMEDSKIDNSSEASQLLGTLGQSASSSSGAAVASSDSSSPKGPTQASRANKLQQQLEGIPVGRHGVFTDCALLLEMIDEKLLQQ